MKLNDKNLLVHSVFPTLSGEVGAIPQGAPAVFIRLAVCDLRCPWCDAKNALTVKDGKEMTPGELLVMATQYDINNFVITGGEPLLQEKPLGEFIRKLCVYSEFTAHIQIETSGHRIPSTNDGMYLIDSYVVDYKLDSSKMNDRMMEPEQYLMFPGKTYIKFVIGSPYDFEQATQMVKRICDKIDGSPKKIWRNLFFAFSPVYTNNDYLKVDALALWERVQNHPFLKDKIILNLQLHKIIGQADIEEKPLLIQKT